MKGHPIRGFIAGLLLGVVLDLDLFLGGVVKSDAAALVIVPVVCIVVAFLLGLWAPIGRRSKPKDPVRPAAQPLPEPVAWPETAPVEGRTLPSPQAWKAPPAARPPGTPGPLDGPPSAAPQDAVPPPPPPAPPI
jgi:hypothetical protein